VYAVYLKLYTNLEIMNEMRQQLRQAEANSKRAKKGRHGEESQRDADRTNIMKSEIDKIESMIA
jgi:hypothetical protein